MLPRTLFLGRLIGLYSIIVSLAMVVHRQETVAMVTALFHDIPLLFLCGAIAVIGGLAMVLGHNIWSGGARPIIVTVVGWLTLIKGALLLFLLPDAASGVFLGALHYGQLFYLYVGISLLLGIYLTYDPRPTATR